jgi:hypothetical protein
MPGDSEKTELPTWLRALAQELRGDAKAPVHVLTPLAALDELVTTASSLVGGRDYVSKPDRTSMREDIQLALDRLGTSTSNLVKPLLRDFQANDLRRLHDLLSDVEGARRARAGAEAVIREFGLRDAALGAWDDCLAAFENGDHSEDCRLRVAQFRELIERRGHGWEYIGQHLGRLIFDDRFAVAERGDISREEAEAGDPRAPAGIPVERRLELCRDAILDAPAEIEVIVWLVFANAHLADGFLRLGPAQFFTSKLWPEGIRDGCPALDTPDYERPRELSDPRAELFFHGLPDEEHVLVRVALEAGPVAGAEKRARDLVLGLVETATRDSGWVLLEGEPAYSERSGWWGSMGFANPQQMERIRRYAAPLHDHTGDELAKIDRSYVDALARREDAALDAVSELRWEQALRDAHDAPHRVGLATRILERALPISKMAKIDLKDACTRHLREDSCFRQLRGELFDAGWGGLNALGGTEPEDELKVRLRAAIFPSGGGLSFTFVPKELIHHARELAKALPEGLMEQRIIAEAHQYTANPNAVLQRLSDHSSRFDRMIARSVRQRNAIIHGALLTPTVVQSCEQFILGLVSRVVRQTLTAAGTGEGVLERLENSRAAWLRQRDALMRGDPPGDVLFSGDMLGS